LCYKHCAPLERRTCLNTFHLMPEYISFLPHLNAVLNTTSAVLLLAGFRFIRLGRIQAHRNCQITAVVTSALFLSSYLTYHYYHGATRFAGQGLVRPVYFTILTTHTILAVVIVPLIFITLYRAARGDFIRHKKIARWTLPLWLYVSVTGVIVYLMLYQIYPSR
jgi:putative membrane protein